MNEGVVAAKRAEDGLTEEEERNLRTVTAFLALPKPVSSEHLNEYAPNFKLRRLGMRNLAEIFGQDPSTAAESPGYNARSFQDRADEIMDIVARGDVVWVLFRLVGTHTGDFWGAPATRDPLDFLELGIFRLERGLIAEAWFMNDELALCRQLGFRIEPPAT